jgi:hypothetical protein
MGRTPGGVENTPNDTTALDLNVLMAADFGKRYHFEGAAQVTETGDSMGSYQNALRIVQRGVVSSCSEWYVEGCTFLGYVEKTTGHEACIEGVRGTYF